MLTNRDRILGGLWGLLIGDALGVPYEFNGPENLPGLEQIEYQPPISFVRSHSGVLPGTWSDDGAQALCLLDSLLSCGKMDINDFASRLLQWYNCGLWAVDNKVFDVGNQTARALIAYSNGKPPYESGNIIPDGKGNGSLMRVLPLALWHKGTDEELVNDAHLQSLVTHGHICNQVCCALYCLWARRLLEGHSISEAYSSAVLGLRKIYSEDSKFYYELEWSIRPDEAPIGKGGGFVVDSLRSARMVLASDNYEQAVKSAIALGDDTDTTAAIAGGLAGIYFGFDNIPNRWYSELRGKEMVYTLIDKLF
ncbi:ADP-ribosylglycohydrolase family protein [Anaerocolumna xylanovorans]|uniref:ADP-ribosylglycohydrolase n=1 Tax=Anaerocolumna xylanovorans DSM 12503 TaxID=1121345 RepID=A0A1M7YIB5_9FIRM|nr:ADP-ribosylglycohydrolase family protein [Anaerocolumna xylanovorans]SHO52351.1 ADP-ribosylglycohydrolase [Anaerocolumna xylanovorans DSM 12503]